MAITQTGRALLSALRRSGSTATLADVPETFFNPDELRAFTWLRQYVQEHRAFPTSKTFKRETHVSTVVTNEPVAYYVEKARQRYMYNQLTEPFAKYREAMNAKKPDDVVEVARSILALANTVEVGRSRGVVTLADALDEVVTDFDTARWNPGLRGITTGWPNVDAIMGGHQRGDLNTLVGRPGRGKTYLLLKQAYAAWQAGHSVMLVSGEVPALQLARRMVGIHTGINPDVIRKGRLSGHFDREFHDGISAMKNGVPFHLVAGHFRKTVPIVRGLAEELEPDIIFADASYLLQPEKKRQGSGARREVVSDVIEELKQVATDLDRPVVQTVQFNREAKRAPRQRGENDNPIAHLNLERIGETDVVGQVSSVVIGIDFYDPPDDNVKRYMGFLKGREGEQGWWVVNYQFKPTVNFDWVPSATNRNAADNPNSQANLNHVEE